jgi:hypothetical protein
MWSEMEWSIRRLDGQRKKKSGLDWRADKSKQEEECSTSGKNEIRKGQMLYRCRKSKRNSPSTCSRRWAGWLLTEEKTNCAQTNEEKFSTWRHESRSHAGSERLSLARELATEAANKNRPWGNIWNWFEQNQLLRQLAWANPREAHETGRLEEKSGNSNHVAGKQFGIENQNKSLDSHSQRLKRKHDQLTNRVS